MHSAEGVRNLGVSLASGQAGERVLSGPAAPAAAPATALPVALEAACGRDAREPTRTRRRPAGFPFEHRVGREREQCSPTRAAADADAQRLVSRRDRRADSRGQ